MFFDRLLTVRRMPCRHVCFKVQSIPYSDIKGKGKVILAHAMEASWGTKNTAPLIFNLGF